jgi:two-component sensor histidine kinase
MNMEQRKKHNMAIVEAMTDEELKETKAMIVAEQVRRVEERIRRLAWQ